MPDSKFFSLRCGMAASCISLLCCASGWTYGTAYARVAPGLAAARSQAGAAQDDPGLHKRSAAQPDGTPTPVVATGHTDLPPEAEGEYPWDKQGGKIEIYFDGGKLNGYMTEHLDPDPHTGPVTYDFVKTHVDGHLVEWTTRAVHGTAYSFSGHLERGLAPTPMQPGYYLLTGTLTAHGGDLDGVARTVSMKRDPGQQ